VKVGVLANGEWDEKWGGGELGGLDALVCADGGANSAMLSGRMPDVVVGDLDSITDENLARCEQAGVEIIRYPREKDETDLELALNYAFARLNYMDSQNNMENDSQPVPEIMLYGATGKRIDHFLGNLALLHEWALKGKKIVLKDPLHKLWIITGKEMVKGKIGQEVSLIPITAKAVVSLEGFYYPLQKGVLRQESPRGISNVFSTDEGNVEVHEGLIIFIQNKMIEEGRNHGRTDGTEDVKAIT